MNAKQTMEVQNLIKKYKTQSIYHCDYYHVVRTHFTCSFFILTKVSVSVTFAAFIVTLLSSQNHRHCVF